MISLGGGNRATPRSVVNGSCSTFFVLLNFTPSSRLELIPWRQPTTVTPPHRCPAISSRARTMVKPARITKKKPKPRTAIPASVAPAAQLGQRLQLARLAKGLLIRELAKKVECSISLISKYENDKALPALATLHKIATVLGTNISALFEPHDAASGIVFRAKDRQAITMQAKNSGGRIHLEPLMPHHADRVLQSMIYTIPPGAGNAEPVRHEGEEIGYILEGMLELIVDRRTFLLAAGDAFTFRSHLDHSFRNPGQATTRVLWVNTPPTF